MSECCACLQTRATFRLACGHRHCLDCYERAALNQDNAFLTCAECMFLPLPTALANAELFTPPRNPLNQFYTQHHAFGYATYWIDSKPNKSYIHYSHRVAWRLDNGDRPPARKFFRNALYDSNTRTFRGVVEWAEGFGGDAKWEYEMVFSRDFMTIQSGRVLKSPSLFVNRFGEALRYELWPGMAVAERIRGMRVLLVLAQATDVSRLGQHSLLRSGGLPKELLRALQPFLYSNK
ncbi:hypothetical protein BASA81_012110 [Batrachochytrium salamandrivorans]|nr:hypothetical protein BASA81_012110 [Batrachochytrium salamandrivorans]